MFQVFLHNSTTTPPQPGYGQLLRAALADVQAEAMDGYGGYRLRDGVEIHVLAGTEDEVSLIEYPERTAAVAEAIFETARRTGSLIFAAGSSVFRIVGNPGEPPSMFAIAIDRAGLGEVENAEDLYDFLGGMQLESAAIEPSRGATRPGERPGFGQRMVDIIFGRAG